ncbi:MAG: DUF3576 domain-containing protein [Geminicoccaceae bacterium]
MSRALCVSVVSLVALALVGCNNVPISNDEFSPYDREDQIERERFGTLTGEDGIRLFGPSRAEEEESGTGGGIGVNAFLWRASLDTIDFMPLTSADPFGGVIITEWYQPTETPDERFKLNVYILDTRLRADALKVSVFRQAKNEEAWLDADVDPATAVELENAILTRARELRIATAGQ